MSSYDHLPKIPDSPTAKALREQIFRIPLLPQGEILTRFKELDQTLFPHVYKLARLSPAVRTFFRDIIGRVASGNTQGKNFFDKEDNEDTGEKRLLKPSELRVLAKSFPLLRLQDHPDAFVTIL